jgi:hypothetical protein
MSGIAADRHVVEAAEPNLLLRRHEPSHPFVEVAFWSLVLVAQFAWIAGLVYLVLRLL